MRKFYLSLISLIFIFPVSYSQMIDAGLRIRDDFPKGDVVFNTPKRSAQNPRTCGTDTVEYPRYKASSLVSITMAKGRGLGQLYSCPKPVTVSGFTFYAFVLPVHKTSKKMEVICRLYKAGSDSLPSGSPLRADTVSIDSTFGGGLLSVFQKKCFFPSITMDSAFILTLETNDDTLTAGVVINNYANADGEGENLNCGSISGLWYNGRNLRVGTTPFNCDILLHPYVRYPFGTDFSIKNNCFGINDSVRFINAAPVNMSGSRMYNRYVLYNAAYICHIWNLGNNTGNQYTVDHKVKYGSRQNYTVRLISTIYGYTGSMYNGCSDTTEKKVLFKPDIPTFSGAVNVCTGDSVRYTAVSNDTGVSFEWFAKPGDPAPFHTGRSYLKYPVSKNNTFYLRANNNGCLSGFRMIALRANTYPLYLNTLNDSVCSGSRANLEAYSDTGSIQWFSSSTGGSPVFTGRVFQTGVLSRDTAFWVQANNNGCILSPRTMVRALVGSSFAPAAPVLSPDTTVCLSSGITVTLRATAGTGLGIRWFSSASGGSSIGTGNTFNFQPVKREVRTYYADAYNGVCGSTRVPVNINVEHYPSVSLVYADTVCAGDSARMGFSLPYGDAAWFDASSGGNLLHNGTSYTAAPAVSTDYYVETSSDVCVNPQRTRITAMVNAPPSVIRLWGDTICAKNRATLKSVLSGQGTMEWFDSDTSSALLATGNSFLTPVLNGNRKYWARPVYAGCTGPRTAVQPLVKSAPFSGFSFEVLTWQQVRVSPINAAGCAIRWEFGDGTVSNLNAVTHRYQNTGTYQIKLILTSLLTGCKDSTTISVQIDPSSINGVSSPGRLLIYPNPATDEFSVSLPGSGEPVLLTVYDMKGTAVRSCTLMADGKSFIIPAQGMAPGIYMVKVDGFSPVLLLLQ